MAGYVHGYATPEQQRLIEQAEHWRDRLIRDGTTLEPGTRLLEVGCGVAAVLAVLGQEYPGLRLFDLDIEPQQLEFARTHLQRSGVEATLAHGDAIELPFPDEAFDHVWMMWFLEHIADPPAVLREARRVLGTGGVITAIEVDYSTCSAEPSSPAIEALFRAMVAGMAASGWSDAGTRLPGWLAEAGFRNIDPGERAFSWQGGDLARQANYAADVMESALDALLQLPGTTEDQLQTGLAISAACHAGTARAWAGSCTSRPPCADAS
jgi:ubiquinone/menaquinone biosynthesis C-methylase UbiE